MGKKNTEESWKEQKRRADNYLKYAGLGFQLAGPVVAAFLIGNWLDKKYGHNIPYLTLIFAVVSIIAVFYQLIKSSSRK